MHHVRFSLSFTPCTAGVCNTRSDVYSLGKIMVLLLPCYAPSNPRTVPEPPDNSATVRPFERSAPTDASSRETLASEDVNTESSGRSGRRESHSDRGTTQPPTSSVTFLHRQLMARVQHRCVRSDPSKRLSSAEVLQVLNDVERMSVYRHVRLREMHGHARAGSGGWWRRGKYGWMSHVSRSLLV